MNARVITELGQGKFAAAESSVMKLALGAHPHARLPSWACA